MSNIIKELSTSKKEEYYALEYLKCRQNPLYFIYNYVHIQEIGGSLRLTKEHVHPKLKRVVRSVFRYHKAMFMASRQLGKALDINTPIPIAHGGYKKLEDIEVGDLLFDGNGFPTEVINTTEIMHNRPCFELVFDNHETIIADENHLWKVSNSSLNIVDKILTSREIFNLINTKLSQYSKSSNFRISLSSIKSFINNDQLFIPPYILGLWLGDGSKDNGRISCSKEDYENYVEIFKNFDFEISEFRLKKNSNSGYFNIYNLLPLLKNYNLIKNKHIPDCYFNTTIEHRLELIRGLMDSDGYAMPSGTCQFFQKDFKLLSQVRRLLSSLGIKTKYNFKLINNCKYNTLTFTNDNYQLFNLDRKSIRQHGAGERNENYNVYIRSINEVDSVPVKCIQVKNSDGMFLCGESMIPTHNSTIAGCLITWAANFFPGIPVIILNMRQVAALENLSRIKFVHSHLPAWMKSPIKGRAERKTYLELENDSLIRTFYPASNTGPDQIARSLTAPILYIDEASFIRHIDIAYRAAQPVLG
jgi:hypothetical protein